MSLRSSMKKMTSWSCRNLLQRRCRSIYRKFKPYTMLPRDTFINNLILADRFKEIDGAIVECGVWRGGAIAGIASLLADKRDYHLFDSFEGMPPAQEIDGDTAKRWGQEISSPLYYDKVRGSERFALEAMKKSGCASFFIHKGWFADTLKDSGIEKIAILRLDADWYNSTLPCLIHLFPKLARGGIMIIDDYHTFSGCSRAVHKYFADNSLSEKIRQLNNDVCFVIKGEGQ